MSQQQRESVSSDAPLRPPSVCVKDTGTAKGRGVFALRDFAEREAVEVCPVVLFRVPFEKLPGEVKRLVFNWGQLAGMPGTQALALGYGSLYNHANPSSLRYEAGKSGLMLRLIASRDIDAGEELTIQKSTSEPFCGIVPVSK